MWTLSSYFFYNFHVYDADVSEDDLCTAAKVPAFDFSLGPGFPPFEVSQLVFLKDLSCLLNKEGMVFIPQKWFDVVNVVFIVYNLGVFVFCVWFWSFVCLWYKFGPFVDITTKWVCTCPQRLVDRIVDSTSGFIFFQLLRSSDDIVLPQLEKFLEERQKRREAMQLELDRQSQYTLLLPH